MNNENPNIYILEDNSARMRWFRSEFLNPTHSEFADGIIDAIKSRKEKIDVLFLDHDLGGETYVDSSEHNTGMTVVNWLCEPHNISLRDDIGQIVVHSLNTDAAKVMTQKLVRAGYNADRIPFIQLTLHQNNKNS